MWLKSNQIKTKVAICMGGKGQNFLVVKFEITIHDSLFKVYYYMLNTYLLNFIIMYIFLFKLVIIIHKFFCWNDFTIFEWSTLCQKFDVTQQVNHLILQTTHIIDETHTWNVIYEEAYKKIFEITIVFRTVS
jgi:hypothetical protein